MKKYLLIILLLLSGCVGFHAPTTISPKVEIIPGQWIQLPQPKQLAFNITAAQILTAKYKIKNKTYSYTSQVQVEKTPQHLILVAVAGWGGELFSIYYNGITIKTSSLPMEHAGLGIQHVLSDFILIYADKNLLDNILKSTNIKLKINKQQRIFLLHNKPIITIHYQNANPWQGNIVLHNLKLNYTIKITTISSFLR
jgi:hypothetical protein